MKVSYKWVKQFIENFDEDIEKVVEKLNETGLESTYEKFGNYIPNLTTVKILSVEKHPEKDNLLVCKATDAEKEYQVITAAKNVKEGDIVVLAKEGAIINGREIKPVKFGSLISEGMFLSFEELGIDIPSEGLFILGKDAPIGADASKLLDLGEDYIIEVEITPNRGDALSVRGLAREIAAIFGKKRTEKLPVVSILKERLPEINIETDLLNRYRGIIVENVKVDVSPLDIQLKLIKSGQKPINNIVDITNFILLQEGQPLHAFDLDKLEGKIHIRQAVEGEKITALDGNEYTLNKNDIVIADDKKAVAIAGIIGGDNTKVDENTKNVLLEAANFDPSAVRKTAKRLGISTDSSYRFERGVDIENLPNAQDKALELILSTAEGKAVGEKDLYINVYKPKQVKLREKQVKRVLGAEIPKEKCSELLNRLEIPTEIVEDGTLSKIPAFRAYDLEREIDLVEEVGRLTGFNNLEETYPSISTENFSYPDYFKLEEKIRKFFISNGLTEVLTYTFSSQEDNEALGIVKPEIEIINYILKSQSLMRNNLVVSLINTLIENLKYGTKDLSIFEIGTTFFDSYEEYRVGFLLTGKFINGYTFTKENQQINTTERWNFLKAKGLINSFLEYIGINNLNIDIPKHQFLNKYESVEFLANNIEIGYIGKIHPKIAKKLDIPEDTYVGELHLKYVSRDLKEAEHKPYLYDLIKEKDEIIYKEIPKFPSVKRDLAFEAEEDFPVGTLLDEIPKTCKLIKKVKLFDVYFIGNGKKSIAVSVEFNAGDRSLTDEEVNQMVEKLINKLNEKFGLKLRK